MIDHEALESYVRDLKIKDYDLEERRCSWIDSLGVVTAGPETMIERAILGSSCQFNFWQVGRKVQWGRFSSVDWWAVVRGEKDIKSMNLAQKRKKLYDAAAAYIKKSKKTGTLEHCITEKVWWYNLAVVFGGDPVHKRETLLWMMLTEMGFSCAAAPADGIIDYNVILFLRMKGIVTGYEGNRFNLHEETMLRKDCLRVAEIILSKRPDITIPMLDVELYGRGREIRHIRPFKEWEPFFCYRPGCFFY